MSMYHVHSPHSNSDGLYRVHQSNIPDSQSHSHSLVHLTHVALSDTKKAVTYDGITHQPSVSSLSTEFVVHSGPNNLSTPVGKAIAFQSNSGTKSPGGCYETEYEHAFIAPSDDIRSRSLSKHHVSEESVNMTVSGDSFIMFIICCYCDPEVP